MEQWRGRRVLVTGDTGFKGAWLALWLQQLGATVIGAGLPPEDRRGAYVAVDLASRVDHHDVDVRDAAATTALVREAEPEVVFHLAAQAIVRRGYAEPALTYETNVVGTVNVLDAIAGTPSVAAAVVVTSDKVYRQDGTERRFLETDELGGNDPYSASKACTELAVAEWRRRTPHVKVSTARAGNVIGGGDRGQDRLLPDVVRCIEANQPASIRHPAATRPWQHVLDALAGYLLLADALLEGREAPPALNFGPERSATVADVLDAFIERLGRGTWTLAEGAQPHEEPRLSLDPTLADTTLGWRPRLDLPTSLDWTSSWYRAQLEGADLLAATLDQIARFEELR
jgi:CDP-glucose 4,6-dehydratase